MGLGEAAAVDGFSLRVFDVRSEKVPEYDTGDPPEDWPRSVAVFLPRPGYGAVYPISAGDGYVAVSVDLVLENASPAPMAVAVQTALTDVRGGSHFENGLTDAWPTGEDDIVEPSETAIELAPGEKEASTAFYALPPGTVPGRLEVLLDLEPSSRGGEREAAVDLTSGERGRIPPEDFLRVYNDYFNQRAYREAYRMLDPSSTRGIAPGDWSAFYGPAWGERYVSLDKLRRVSAGPTRATFEVDRAFYGADGRPMPDKGTNADTTQEMVRRGDEWKLVLSPASIKDILSNRSSSTASATPQPTTPGR